MNNFNKLPKFPNFLPVSLDMQDEIVSITSTYPQYHDFSVGNLYCWNTDNSIRVCTLNNNLVVHFADYTNDSKHYYSYLGNNDSEDTAIKLIEYSKYEIGIDYLRYVPEISVSKLDDNKFQITPIRDDFDYIYDMADYSDINNLPNNLKPEYNAFLNKYKENANFYTYQSVPQELNLAILEIFTTWQTKKQNSQDYMQEKVALTNMINFPIENANFWTLILYDNNKPIGFTINEIPSNNEYAIGHFCKADTNYKKIFDFITVETFLKLSNNGVRYFNMEPDLGIEGLRINKEHKRPSGFLKKYKVCIKNEPDKLSDSI